MIREARPGDEEGLFALVQQLGHAFPPERAAFDRTVASYFSGSQPGVVLFVVDDGKGLQGYALTTIVPLLSTNGPSAQLQEIVVDPSARGHDYGTQLVRAVEAECEARGVTQLTVASRRAGGFYDRLGFHESAEYMRRFFLILPLVCHADRVDWVWWVITGAFVVAVVAGWIFLSGRFSLSRRASKAVDPELARAMHETQADIDKGSFYGRLGG